MSSEHVAHDTLERLRSRLLTPEETLAAFAHIEQCGECAMRAGGNVPRAGRAVYAALSTSSVEHLDPDSQLFPYVDGTADAADREIVESHIEDCAMCRAELDDLRKLRRARRSWWPAFAAAAAVAIIGATAMLIPRDAPATRRVEPVRKAPAPAVVDVPQSLAHASPEVRDAIANRALPFPADLDKLAPPREVLRGKDRASNESIAPAGIVVMDTRPWFSWPAKDDARYIVTVFRDHAEVARSEELTQPRWRPERSLARGHTYQWQIEVLRGDAIDVIPAPPAPPAMFRIVSDADAERIRTAKRDHPEDELLHAVAYAKAGLREEAMDALRRAASRGNKDASAILQQMR